MPCINLRKYTWSFCAFYLLEELHLVESVCLVLTSGSTFEFVCLVPF